MFFTFSSSLIKLFTQVFHVYCIYVALIPGNVVLSFTWQVTSSKDEALLSFEAHAIKHYFCKVSKEFVNDDKCNISIKWRDIAFEQRLA